MTIALVTGVVGGIGRAIARRMQQDGFDVVVSDLPGTPFDNVVRELAVPGLSADLGQRPEVESLLDTIVDQYGAPAVLVSAAGGVCGQRGQPLQNVPEADWRAIFAANVDSVFFLAQAVAPQMIRHGAGRIVTISSGAGLRPSLTGIQAYTAAKHALVGLTRQLAQELGPSGITVNSVAPGFVLSNPSSIQQWQSYGAEGQQRLIDRIHTRRLGTPEDIAHAVAFLIHPDSSWITGQVLSVDGGVV